MALIKIIQLDVRKERIFIQIFSFNQWHFEWIVSRWKWMEITMEIVVWCANKRIAHSLTYVPNCSRFFSLSFPFYQSCNFNKIRNKHLSFASLVIFGDLEVVHHWVWVNTLAHTHTNTRCVGNWTWPKNIHFSNAPLFPYEIWNVSESLSAFNSLPSAIIITFSLLFLCFCSFFWFDQILLPSNPLSQTLLASFAHPECWCLFSLFFACSLLFI